MEVLDDLSLVGWFLLWISEQGAEMLRVVVVEGMKLGLLLSKEMASGGSDLEVKLWTLFDEDRLIFFSFILSAALWLKILFHYMSNVWGIKGMMMAAFFEAG